jgi:hypothetical protein
MEFIHAIEGHEMVATSLDFVVESTFVNSQTGYYF